MASIQDYQYYHGAALTQIAEHEAFTSINKLPGFDVRSVYMINHDKAIYVKHSTSATNEWMFNFAPEHQATVRRLFELYPERTFVVLVCNDEICALTYAEYAACIDENFREQEGIRVWRPDGGRFRVVGANGELSAKIPLNRYPRLIFEGQ